MNSLRRRIDRFCVLHPNFGIPNLMLYIVIGNIAFYLLSLFSTLDGGSFYSILSFSWAGLKQGQLWRLLSFSFLPTDMRPFWLLVSCYFYYWIGSTLEREWGTAKFTIYYLSGVLLTALGAQYDILVVLDLVVFDVAAGYLDGAVGDIVDEGAVVAHQHHGFGRLGEKLLKPLYALDVEVVGRLVEQEHVGLLQENLGELDAHAPATGELARGAVEVAALEAQTGEGALEGGFVVVSAEHHVAVVLESELLDQLGIALALVVGAVGHFLLQPLDALLHAGGVDEGFAGLFDDGGVVGEFHHLRQIAYGGVVGDGYSARGGFLLSAEYLEHGRFAGAVLAHERYAVAVVDDKTHVMEERAGAELYSEIFYRNHIYGLQYACTALSCWGVDGRQGVAVCLYIRFNYSSHSGHDAQTRRRDLC